MIPLTNRSSATTQKLQAFLAGAAATTNPTVTVGSYIVPPQSKTVSGPSGSIAGDPSEYRSAPQFTVLAGATETDIADAPPEGSVKDINYISIYNADTASVTVTVCVDDNATNRILIKATLATLETLYYEDGRGWYVTTASGANKINAGIATISSSTDNAFVRWDGASGTLVQNSSATLDDNGRPTFPTTVGVGNATPSTSGSGISFPATQSASTDANTLDDYEEGTWTPSPTNLTVVGTPTYTSRYTKVGRLGFVYLSVESTVSTASTFVTTTFTGLPFSAISNSTCGGAALGGSGQSLSCGAVITSTLYPPTWAANANVVVTSTYDV